MKLVIGFKGHLLILADHYLVAILAIQKNIRLYLVLHSCFEVFGDHTRLPMQI